MTSARLPPRIMRSPADGDARLQGGLQHAWRSTGGGCLLTDGGGLPFLLLGHHQAGGQAE